MQLGDRIGVTVELDGSREVVGRAQVITPDIVQAIPPLDVWLLANDPDPSLTVRADEDGGPGTAVRAVYPAFQDGQASREVAAAACPDLVLLDGPARPVFLGLVERLCDEDPCDGCVGENPLCKVGCFWFCTNC